MSSKRHRTSSDEESVVSDDDGSVSPQSKRPRMSTEGLTETPRFGLYTQADVDLDTSPGDEDEEERAAREERAKRVQERDDRNAELIEAARREEAEANRVRLEDRIPAENAIIEEVRCENFMNHTKLTLELGPFINFIVGHNGSGKSAVLSALTICLGGKPKKTERAKNIKDFIKNGEEHCIVSVKLKNQGTSAYQPELYGDSIIVERHISRTSGSSFKIKNANGKIVTTKKADLDDITETFALQLDNPMNVLTQDKARSFLHNSTPAAKYEFFLEGTQLLQLSKDYILLEDSLNSTEVQLERVDANRKAAKLRLKDVKAKLAAASEQEKLRRKINKVRAEMVWSVVVGEEQHRDHLQGQLEAAENAVQQQEIQKAETEKKYSEIQERLAEMQERLDEARQEVDPVQEELNAKNGEIKEVDNKMQAALEEERNMQGEISSNKKSIEKIKSNRDEELKRQEAADGGTLVQLNEDIREAQDQQREAEEDVNRHAESLPLVDREQKQAEYQLKSAQSDLESARSEMQQTQRLLDEHSNKQGNWMRSYPQTLPNVLREISKERRFRDAPVGPLGKYIQLSKPEWSSILEMSTGEALHGFAVTNKDDQSILRKIFHRLQYKAPIYISSAERMNSIDEPDPQQLTWLRALKISNEIVRNVLITTQSIEQHVLIQSRKEATDYIATGPKNVRCCLAMHDNIRGRGHRLNATASGGKGTQPISAFNGHPRMQSDAEAQLSIYRENVARSKNEFNTHQQKVKDLESALRQKQNAMAGLRKRTRELNLAKQRAEEKLDILKDRLEEATPKAAGVLAVFEQQLASAERDLSVNEDSLRASMQERAEDNGKKAELTNEMKKIKARLNKAKSQLATKEQARDNTDQTRRKLLAEKNTAFSNVDDKEAERGQAARKLEVQQARVAEAADMASEHCPDRVPVNTGDTTAILKKRGEMLQQQLKDAEKLMGYTHEELATLSEKVAREYDEIEEGYELIETQSQALKTTMADRMARWKKFRRFIASRARIHFTYLLAERRFRGKLDIDPHSKQLDISVEPDATKTRTEGRQAKTLSGGEKSFSTICLLLSLWDAMGSPIRCLDEFDVFMDSVNRDISMKLMIDAARKSVQRQFILITPQAMTNVAGGPDVRIHRLSDPERGQQTLSIGA